MGHEEDQQAELRHLRDDRAIEPVLAIEITDARGDLAGRPFAHRPLEQLMVVGQVEVHFLNSTSRVLVFRRN